MLADNFKRIRNAREVDCLIPLKQLRKINEKAPDLVFGETEAEFARGYKKELAQGALMFHVEPLRQTVEEVKDCFTEITGLCRTDGDSVMWPYLSLVLFESDQQYGDGGWSDTGNS